MKKEYFDCDCSGFHCVVRFSYFPEDKDFLYLETYMAHFGFFSRVWRAVKYVFGVYTPYNDSCLGPETVKKVRDACNEFLNYDFVPEKSRSLYDWLYRYDVKFAGRPKEIIAELINKGAEQLYKEGLENADPLPKEVYDAMVESQRAALEEAIKEK